jgi:predicted small lipoprotein YifL
MRRFGSLATPPLCEKSSQRLTLPGLLAIALISLAAAGCGQKGPLFLPKATPAASAASAPAR